jgi:hypothetical protein
MKTLSGFDYTVPAAVEHDSRKWRERMAAVVADGGFRRVESGETFAHDRSGRIVFEVYATLPKPVRS